MVLSPLETGGPSRQAQPRGTSQGILTLCFRPSRDCVNDMVSAYECDDQEQYEQYGHGRPPCLMFDV